MMCRRLTEKLALWGFTSHYCGFGRFSFMFNSFIILTEGVIVRNLVFQEHRALKNVHLLSSGL